MRKSLLHCLLTCLILWSTGCVVVVKKEERVPTGHVECPFSEHTIEEIDAVAKLTFDSQRHDAYVRIARRECLSDEAQVHLVKEALAKLPFENSREKVLLALIHGPSFSCEGQRAILSHIDRLQFDNTRSKILKEIDERGACDY